MGRSSGSGRCAPAALAALATLSTIVALAGCNPTGGPSLPSIPADATQHLVSPVVSSASPAPARTPVPGYEEWSTITAQAVRITRDGDALVLELVGSVLWFESERGVLFHTEITGDFRATATVRTAKASDPDAAPGGDGTIQLAGLMARSDAARENYVYIVTGSLGPSTGVETKSTTADESVYTQTTTAGAGDADLRLCRQGDTFRHAFRPAGTSDPWLPVTTFDRPDLPKTLQVGANIYANAAPDLSARYDRLTIEPLTADAAC